MRIEVRTTGERFLVLLVALTLIACNTTEKDWERASRRNSAPGYAEFLAKHPHGAHADTARAELAAWDEASAVAPIFDADKPLEDWGGKAIVVTGVIGPDSRAGRMLIVPVNPWNAAPAIEAKSGAGRAIVSVPNGELLIYPDSLGSELNTKMSEKLVHVEGVLTGTFGLRNEFGINLVEGGKVNGKIRSPEIRVTSYKAAP